MSGIGSAGASSSSSYSVVLVAPPEQAAEPASAGFRTCCRPLLDLAPAGFLPRGCLVALALLGLLLGPPLHGFRVRLRELDGGLGLELHALGVVLGALLLVLGPLPGRGLLLDLAPPGLLACSYLVALAPLRVFLGPQLRRLCLCLGVDPGRLCLRLRAVPGSFRLGLGALPCLFLGALRLLLAPCLFGAGLAPAWLGRRRLRLLGLDFLTERLGLGRPLLRLNRPRFETFALRGLPVSGDLRVHARQLLGFCAGAFLCLGVGRVLGLGPRCGFGLEACCFLGFRA